MTTFKKQPDSSEIELKLNLSPSIQISKKSITAYGGISSIYNRIVELRYKCSLCNKVFEYYSLDLTRKIWKLYSQNLLSNALNDILQEPKETLEKINSIIELIQQCYDTATILRRKLAHPGRRKLQELESPEDTKEVTNQFIMRSEDLLHNGGLLPICFRKLFTEIQNKIKSPLLGKVLNRLDFKQSDEIEKWTKKWREEIEDHKDDYQLEDYYQLSDFRDIKKVLDAIPSKALTIDANSLEIGSVLERLLEEEDIDNLFFAIKEIVTEFWGEVKEEMKGDIVGTALKAYYVKGIETIFSQASKLAKDDIQKGRGFDNAPVGDDTGDSKAPPSRTFLLSFLTLNGAENSFDIKAMTEFLITDAIYCSHKLLDYSQTYGLSYMNTHSLLGSTYAKLSTWSDRYEMYKQFHKHMKNAETEKTLNERDCAFEIKKRLDQVIPEDEQQTLRYSFNSEMALQYYRFTKELHNEGKTYKNLIENMFYLNDDFNDHRYHFSAAIERYWLNTGIIDERIKKLKKVQKMSSLYDLTNYDR